MNYLEKNFLTLTASGSSKIVYSDYAPENSKMIICVHGLTGNGHDFDAIAQKLVEDGYRVIAVDMPGRGRSDFFSNPADYAYDQYLQDLNALLAHLDITEPQSIDWLGVSMGGLLGISLASVPNSPIKRLILNDIGPYVPKEALDFIAIAISQTYEFKNLEEFKQRLKDTRGLSWGPMSEEDWDHMAQTSHRVLDNGKISYAYDPAIYKNFTKEPIGNLDYWAAWDSLNIPALIIRGESSLVFPEDTAQDMLKRGPGFKDRAKLVTIPNAGHVPSLMQDDQIKTIQDWLSETDSLEA